MTPFLLAGRDGARVSVAGGLALQVAEALSGVAIVQAIRPGAPCLFGSFFTAVDMRTRRPGVRHARVGARHARRRPARAPLRPAVSRRRRPVLVERARRPGGDRDGHELALGDVCSRLRLRAARGRLARGRPDGVLREARARPRGAAHVRRLRAGRSRSATSSSRWTTIRERGPGRHVPGRRHTLEHFRDWVFMSPLFRSQAYSDLGEAGRRETSDGGDRPSGSACSRVGGSRDRRARRRGAARVHRPAQGASSTPMMRARLPRHDILFEPVQHRAEDAAQPLLPGAALHRLRRREAVDAGRAIGA